MLWEYGTKSIAKLDTCHPELQDVFHIYRRHQLYDITIVHGWRGKEIQDKAFADGNSGKKWPKSKHNILDAQGEPLSDAVDFAPWCLLETGRMGIPWKDTHAFAVIGGALLAISKELGYNFRYGGDWDMDGLTTDQRLMDWGHIERY